MTPEALGRCMICGARVTASFWLCSDCETEYGLGAPYRCWPSWAKQLSEDHRQMRLSERDRLQAGELTFTDAPEAERLAYGEINDDPWLD